MKLKYILFIIILIAASRSSFATSFTWVGTTTDWANSNNWYPSGIPDSADNVTISSGTNGPLLDGNRKITNLTLSSKTINLNGYSLTVYGTATMTSGTVTNGTFYARGNLASFNGTLMDCPVDAICGYIRLSGSTFNETADFTDLGAATGTGSGGCTFNDDVTITHTGTLTYFTLANTTGDTFNGNVTFTNSSNREIHIASSGATLFNGNVILNSTSSGGISFASGGGSATLASGKTISIGSSGFSADFLTLKNFTQNGSTAQTLTLTGTAVVNMIAATFNGNITVTAPGILLKNNTFNGTATLTRNGSSGNHQSDGGNTFNTLTLDNAGSAGRVRWATTLPDTYNADATFSSTGGQDVQIAYSGDNTFAGNITINSNKVVFNTNTGKVTFTGTNNQTLNGSYNYPFKKLAINKTSGTVTANTTLSVDDSLIFIQGKLITTSANLLTMKHGSIAYGASNSSFVSGPVKKIGNSAFVFNVGSGNTYRPLTITAPSNSTDAFTAEYYSAGQTLGSTKDTTITFVSDCGYWKLDRNVGSSNITPKFAFDSLHCDYLTVKPVHIALWNGTKWTDKGEAVTESTNKTTISAMTSYGYFVFAYNLKAGEAPQMPYELSSSSGCSGSDMLFDNDVFWISFKPDSAIVKLTLFNTDVNKWYAPIKSMDVISEYQLNQIPDTFEVWSFPCDSLLRNTSIKYAELDTSQVYILRIEKYVEGDCDGIKDSTNYYLNACVTNCKMSITPVLWGYDDIISLQTALSVAGDGDFVYPSAPNLEILIPIGQTPLIVAPGVILTGDYDLWSVGISLPSPVINLPTSPTGTRIRAEDNRAIYNAGLPPSGYLFELHKSATIQNLRIQGSMPGFQDYNFDRNLCGGIHTIPNSATTGTHEIRNCEIYNLSYAGVFVDQNCDEVNITDCQIHHIKGEGGGDAIGKGYGVWSKGKDVDNSNTIAAVVNITDCIFDDCKSAIDFDSDFIDLTAQNNTFGNIFSEETVNGHSTGGYDHPGLSGSVCEYFTNCVTESCGGDFLVSGVAPGEVRIKNSIFYQKIRNGKNISQINLPYRFNNPLTASTSKIYTIDVSDNTFAVGQDLPGAFLASLCNEAGYFKLADNYAESCTWDYDRLYDVDGNPIIGTSNLPRLINSPNSFGYKKGVPVSTSSPQPPEIKLSISNALGEVPGYDSNSPTIPFIEQGATVELTCENAPGVTAQSLSYIIRPHPNNGTFEDENTSAENNYNLESIVTAASNAAVTSTFGSAEWNTSNPGLYGIDVAGVQTSTTAVNYQSDWIYQPLIIAPDLNYILSFNIKDSYFEDLYGVSAPLSSVYKQVALNGHVIWRESITEGGDDWEYVRIDIKNDVDPINGNPIFDHIVEGSEPNTLTFSIAIVNPGNISTIDLRGLFVWVDDVYLKKFDAPNNLLRDGGLEYSVGSTPAPSPNNASDWYYSHDSDLSACFTLDEELVEAEPAMVDVKFAGDDRKSGSQSLKLILDGVHAGLSGACIDYGFITDIGPNNVVVSASVNFDYRDFIGCADYDDFGFTPISITSPISSALPTLINGKFILDQNIEINNNGVLILNGCEIVVVPNTPPFEIIVNTGGILSMNSSLTNPSRIFTCGNFMWPGITNNGGIVIIDAAFARPTEIKDAITAIESIGGTLKIKSAVFDQNHIALDLKNGAFLHSGPQTGDGLMGIDFKCTGGVINKSPHSSEPSLAHIQLTNVSDIQIGFIGAANHASYTNNFSDAIYGIKAINSQATIMNNSFTSINNPTNSSGNCTYCGSSIYFENTDNVSRDLTIGNIYNVNSGYEWTEYYENNFSNSKNGITIRGDQSVLIQSNEFSNLYQGIRCNRNLFDVTINEENNFSDVKFGIILFNVRNDILIDGNIFNDPTERYENLNFFRTAISIQNSNTIPTNLVNITNNTISKYRIGIHGLNSQITALSGNRIQFNIGNSLTNYHGGIWLQNCPDAFISDNDISNTEFLPDLNFRGIDIQNSLNCDINCNTISRIGVGINFSGYCDNSELRKNILTDFDIGININNSKIALHQGVQGGIPYGQNAWDNQWFMTGNNTNTFKVGGQWLGNPVKINWYHQGLDGPSYSYSPNPYPLVLVNARPNENSALITCASTLLTSGDRVLEFGSIVGDSATYAEYSEENVYLARTIAYKAMKLDSTIIYQGDSLDADFEAFFERHDSTNIGKLYLVESLIEREPDSALAINNGIAPDNDIESYLIEHYQRTQDISEREGELYAADSAFYLERTVGMPTIHGEVYYHGLGNLFIEQHIPIVASRIGQQPIVNQPLLAISNKSELLVFPNPTTGLLTIRLSDQELKLSQIEIYNSMGDLVISKQIENNNYLLDMTPYNQGIYFIRGMDESKKYYTKSFNLLK